MSNVFGFKSRKRKLVCICGKVNHHLKRGQLILSRDVFLLRDFDKQFVEKYFDRL